MKGDGKSEKRFEAMRGYVATPAIATDASEK